MIICDLDGTLTDSAMGTGHCMNSTHSKEEILRIMDPVVIANLKPRLDVIDMVNKLAETDDIVIVTGRWDLLRSVTYAWLQRHNVRWYRLYMRPFNDWTRKAVDVKLDLFEDVKRRLAVHMSAIPGVTWIDDDKEMIEAVKARHPGVGTVLVNAAR